MHMEDIKDSEGKEARVWRTRNSDNIIAKDASGKLDMFEATNWSNVFAKVLSAGGGEA